MAHERLQPVADSVEIGTVRYSLTQETRQFFDGSYRSSYPKDTSVLIIGEPHESSEGQFNLFKGLESFFASNPKLVEQTIFLSEGTAAGKPISVQPLIDEDPHPSDETIRQVLQSHLITGYMAYEWKYQQGIPIIGTEDDGLYELSRRFASLCREDPNAVFQHLKSNDGTEFDIPLTYAWGFVIAARNRCIAQTLMEQIGIYNNPILFAAWDHVKDARHRFMKKGDGLIKQRFVAAQHMGSLGQVVFPWSGAGEDQWLYRHVKEDCETFDIHHYLEEARIGYTFLNAKELDIVTPEDERNYLEVFKFQRKTTVEADPDSAASFLRALKLKSVVYEREEKPQQERAGWFQVSRDDVRSAVAKDTIWGQPIEPQGKDFETVRNVNLGSNCPHIDDIVVDTMTVTQHKSMDLTLPTYLVPDRMALTMIGYIDKLDERTKEKWSWYNRQTDKFYNFERGLNFQDRYLELGIPAGRATQEQIDKLVELQEYAQTRDVTLVIVEVP